MKKGERLKILDVSHPCSLLKASDKGTNYYFFITFILFQLGTETSKIETQTRNYRLPPPEGTSGQRRQSSAEVGQKSGLGLPQSHSVAKNKRHGRQSHRESDQLF
ncbi:hypothetical protein JTE90_029301 [Oedothorax gibbosus]|uniref:Uncharacterized protein n=1 Tax=Oedothorax gibbosus TaxID=931172 RepID=A0AAV6TYC9_9ARAC|nr:hypothetical protein JTE90_029301 [Oedothorax gibbosus]